MLLRLALCVEGLCLHSALFFVCLSEWGYNETSNRKSVIIFRITSCYYHFFRLIQSSVSSISSLPCYLLLVLHVFPLRRVSGFFLLRFHLFGDVSMSRFVKHSNFQPLIAKRKPLPWKWSLCIVSTVQSRNRMQTAVNEIDPFWLG